MIDQIQIEDIKKIAVAAGAEVMAVYGTEFSVDVKEDKSPLTEADRRANTVIVEALETLEGGPDQKHARLLEFGVTDDEAFAVGLACRTACPMRAARAVMVSRFTSSQIFR